jgi:N-acetylmuramic acid 6-phosphate etherase
MQLEGPEANNARVKPSAESKSGLFHGSQSTTGAKEAAGQTGRVWRLKRGRRQKTRKAAADVAKVKSVALPPTERRNPRSMELDRLPVREAIELMLSEEAAVPDQLLQRTEAIARAIQAIVRTFRAGGRLFYVGAGTSGRLGVLDASECPPTFQTPPEMVQGVIAGEDAALRGSVEGAEDDADAGAEAMSRRKVSRRDAVVGITASGTTPFVWGALGEAKARGATTLLVCFNPYLKIPRRLRPSIAIAVDLGPEVLTGSTRLKAGTATKLVLNLFSTLSMVRFGKVTGNLMSDVNASNVKLQARAVRIAMELSGTDERRTRAALGQTRWSVRRALARLRKI